MSRHPAPSSVPLPDPIIVGEHTLASVTEKIADVPLHRRFPRWWIVGFCVTFLGVLLLLFSITYLVMVGVGIWGINIPVAWGFAIINLVWWIGIGHAGTLISAILLLLRQQWRTSINRFAEAMTLFAVTCAGLFPLFHLGRVWRFYYLFPYPDTLGLWPQWRSPLVWDVVAISTYGTVSLLFWYVGLIPDLATMRDRAHSRGGKRTYGVFALGWRGSARHWHRYQIAYLLLAGLSTPLVVSVHTVVSLDFAVSVLPGWHATIFPPYFVAGAIYSGFAMVLTLAIPLRVVFKLQDLITTRHLENMAKIMLVTGLIVAYGYISEIAMSLYSGHEMETYVTQNRFFGPYAPMFWALLLCNIAIPQLLWVKKLRRRPSSLFVLAIIVNIGMWLERFIIVITSLHRDFLPSSWDMYYPTFWDWAMFIGSIGLFLWLFFVFIRILPSISMFEVRELLHHRQSHAHHAADEEQSA